MNEKWYPLRVAVLFAIAMLLSCVAHGQSSREKTFPLNKEFVATVAVCSNEQYAKEVAEDGPATFQFLAVMGACMAGTTKVTYLRLIYTSKDGTMRVYEVSIAGHKVFAVTDWKAESI